MRERRGPGRPSTFNWPALWSYAVALGMTGSHREAEKLCRVSRRQILRWRDRDERVRDLLALAWYVGDTPPHPEKGTLNRHQSVLWRLLGLDPDDPRFHTTIKAALREVLRG